ncbi:MAG: outer membrane beta-barrel protein [Desulfobacterales bacterium]|nr:outer membrane beta-barrel protein [Desulfobacterales bacterium]
MKEKITLLVAGLLFAVPPNPASGKSGRLEIIPALTLRQEYNDNILFTRNNERHDFITTVSPEIGLRRMSERLKASLTGRLNRIYHAKNKQFDDWDHQLSGRFEYRLSPRLSLSASATFTRDSRPDRDIEETGLVLGTEARDRQQYSFAWSYMLADEKTAVSGNAAYSSDDFAGSDSLDLESYNLGLGLSRNLSAFTKPTAARVNVAAGRYDYPGVAIKNYNLTVGVSRDFSETLRGDISIGPRYTSTRYEAIGLTEGSWGATGTVSLSSEGIYTSSDISLSHDMAAASGRIGTTEKTSAVLELGRKFSDTVRGKLSAGYYRNRTERGQLGGRDSDEQTFRIRPRLRYGITDDLDLIAAYTLTRICDSKDDTDKKRSLLFFQLRYQSALFE